MARRTTAGRGDTLISYCFDREWKELNYLTNRHVWNAETMRSDSSGVFRKATVAFGNHGSLYGSNRCMEFSGYQGAISVWYGLSYL